MPRVGARTHTRLRASDTARARAPAARTRGRSFCMAPSEEKAKDDDPLGREGPLGLQGRIAFFMGSWYVLSGATLFGNKHIMSTLGCDPNVLAMSQMCSTAFFGALKMYGPRLCGLGKEVATPQSSQSFNQFMCDMLTVGVMRFVTVMLGLVSLKFVAVSFTETVKSSAPFFTVIFARLMLGERTSLMVNLSLVPVVGGLALCSATELSFNYIGFLAAVFNNCIDCVQNVFSKKLLSTHYNYIVRSSPRAMGTPPTLPCVRHAEAVLRPRPELRRPRSGGCRAESPVLHFGGGARAAAAADALQPRWRVAAAGARVVDRAGAPSLPQRRRLPPAERDGLRRDGPHLARLAVGGQHAEARAAHLAIGALLWQ